MQSAISLLTPITKGFRRVTENSVREASIAKRAARIKNVGQIKTEMAKGKAYIVGGCKPVVDEMAEMSDSVDIVAKTTKVVQKKIRIAKKNDPSAGKFKSIIQGLKNSKQELKEAVQEFIGVKDVRAATQEKGIFSGLKEAGKASARVALSGTLYVLGNLVPVIPATSIAGLIAGEKIANTLFGKPFTKQAKKAIGQLENNGRLLN